MVKVEIRQVPPPPPPEEEVVITLDRHDAQLLLTNVLDKVGANLGGANFYSSVGDEVRLALRAALEDSQ